MDKSAYIITYCILAFVFCLIFVRFVRGNKNVVDDEIGLIMGLIWPITIAGVFLYYACEIVIRIATIGLEERK